MTTESQIPDTLRQKIVSMAQDIVRVNGEAEAAAEKSQGYKQSATAYRETEMKFFDRWFFGWFGKKEKVTTYKNLKSLTAEFNAKAEDLRGQASNIDVQADSAVEDFLKTSDPHFQKVSACHAVAAGMKDEVSGFMSRVDNALDEIGGASSMEMLDLFSDSTAVSVLSYMENDDANDAIKEVSHAVPAFQKALQGYNLAVKDFDTAAVKLTGVGDGLDLMLDIAFDGFDFMSIFTLSKLSDASSNMSDLREKVEEIDKVVSQNVERSGAYLKSYKNDVRVACLR